MNKTLIKINNKWYVEVAPPKLAVGHNPHGVTDEQVGEGWRLLKDISEKPHPRAECWYPSENMWKNRFLSSCYCKNSTYRVPTSPVKRPLTAADFPPGTAIRDVDCPGTYRLVLGTGTEQIRTICGYENYKQLMHKCLRLLPGTTEWLPCYTEE